MWEKILGFFSRFLSPNKIPRKLAVFLLALALNGLQAKFPDWPLPSPDFLWDIVLAFYAAHAGTDVAHIIKTAIVEYAAGRATVKP